MANKAAWIKNSKPPTSSRNISTFDLTFSKENAVWGLLTLVKCTPKMLSHQPSSCLKEGLLAPGTIVCHFFISYIYIWPIETYKVWLDHLNQVSYTQIHLQLVSHVPVNIQCWHRSVIRLVSFTEWRNISEQDGGLKVVCCNLKFFFMSHLPVY